MRTRNLGATALTVSQVGLGTWPLAGNAGLQGYGRVDPERAEQIVRAAIDIGVTLFETANVYGDGFAETLLGRLVADGPGSPIICTKGGLTQFRHGSPIDLRELSGLVDASRERLRRDVIDIYLLHNPPPHLIGLSDLYRPLIGLRDRGRIRHIGLAVAQPRDAWLALDRQEVEVIQLPFNLLQTEADNGLIQKAHRLGKGILARETLANGLLSGKYDRATSFAADDFRATLSPALLSSVSHSMQSLDHYRRPSESRADFALRFVLDRPEFSCAIVGARTPDQIDTLRHAGTIIPSHPT